ncbi:D-inositol-3-phosphate glycosyltransferase [Sporomusa rhizae]|uniref:glycosyltransferase n=1 Tax=Sporomusa rhizae TaxID=357999 RepID=UPI00352A6BD0
MYKIIFLIRSLEIGGSERQLTELATRLQLSGFEVLVLTFYPDNILGQQLEESGVRILSLHKKGRWDIFAPLIRLLKIIHNEKPDILHSYLGISNILSALVKVIYKDINVVWGVRCSAAFAPNWLDKILYYLEKKLSAMADLIISNSFAGRDYAIQKGFVSDKFVVIPNGIDVDKFCPNVLAKKRLRNELGINDDVKVVGVVARLDPIKNHKMFLKAAKIISHNRKNLRFLCIGDGPSEYRKALEDLSVELGLKDKVLWVGARSDMPDVYNALDLLCLASYAEGFPNVIAEAMACGLPVVVTSAGDAPLIVGKAGIVVQQGDAQAFANAIGQVLAEREKFSALELTRKVVVDNFSTEKLVSTTSKVIRELLMPQATRKKIDGNE